DRTPKMLEKEWRQELQAECQVLAGSQQIVIDEEKLSLSQPASTCQQCKTPIRWYQNIPVISWLALRGIWGSCQNPLSIRYPLVELLSSNGSLTVVAVYGPTLQLLFGVLLTCVLITLTFIDFDTQLLPDRFTLTLAAVGLGINSFEIYTTANAAIWGYIIGFLCLWIFYY
ncbi:prepilin peptidase, partial [Enterococcus casseliflavus]|nr:prepilin peptidase [Enterococcus casseliflavus]